MLPASCLFCNFYFSLTSAALSLFCSSFSSRSKSSNRFVNSVLARCRFTMSSRTGSGRFTWSNSSCGKDCLLRFTTWPGTPTTVELGGTSFNTTLPAPILLLSPILKEPSTFAPVLIITLLPTVGWRLPCSLPVPPNVTP